MNVNLESFTYISVGRMRMVGNVERMGDITNAYKIFVIESEGKGPLGKFTRSLVYNIIVGSRC